jgi:hypothetical protein
VVLVVDVVKVGEVFEVRLGFGEAGGGSDGAGL